MSLCAFCCCCNFYLISLYVLSCYACAGRLGVSATWEDENGLNPCALFLYWPELAVVDVVNVTLDYMSAVVANALLLLI